MPTITRRSRRAWCWTPSTWARRALRTPPRRARTPCAGRTALPRARVHARPCAREGRRPRGRAAAPPRASRGGEARRRGEVLPGPLLAGHAADHPHDEVAGWNADCGPRRGDRARVAVPRMKPLDVDAVAQETESLRIAQALAHAGVQILG